jgi:hypothetical protein
MEERAQPEEIIICFDVDGTALSNSIPHIFNERLIAASKALQTNHPQLNIKFYIVSSSTLSSELKHLFQDEQNLQLAARYAVKEHLKKNGILIDKIILTGPHYSSLNRANGNITDDYAELFSDQLIADIRQNKVLYRNFKNLIDSIISEISNHDVAQQGSLEHQCNGWSQHTYSLSGFQQLIGEITYEALDAAISHNGSDHNEKMLILYGFLIEKCNDSALQQNEKEIASHVINIAFKEYLKYDRTLCTKYPTEHAIDMQGRVIHENYDTSTNLLTIPFPKMAKHHAINLLKEQNPQAKVLLIDDSSPEVINVSVSNRKNDVVFTQAFCAQHDMDAVNRLSSRNKKQIHEQHQCLRSRFVYNADNQAGGLIVPIFDPSNTYDDSNTPHKAAHQAMNYTQALQTLVDGACQNLTPQQIQNNYTAEVSLKHALLSSLLAKCNISDNDHIALESMLTAGNSDQWEGALNVATSILDRCYTITDIRGSTAGMTDEQQKEMLLLLIQQACAQNVTATTVQTALQSALSGIQCHASVRLRINNVLRLLTLKVFNCFNQLDPAEKAELNILSSVKMGDKGNKVAVLTACVSQLLQSNAEIESSTALPTISRRT